MVLYPNKLPESERVCSGICTEYLVVEVAVEMFHQLPVGESGVGFQDHKGNLCQRAKNVPASKTLFRQAYGFCHTAKREN